MFDVDIQEGKPPLKLPFNITGKNIFPDLVDVFL